MGSDATPSPADTPAIGHPQPIPLRDGVLHIEELPMERTRIAAYQIVHQAGPVVRDAHGAYVTSAPTSPGWRCEWLWRNGIAGSRSMAWRQASNLWWNSRPRWSALTVSAWPSLLLVHATHQPGQPSPVTRGHAIETE